MRVAPENVTRLWPQILPLLEPMLSRRPTHDADDIHKSLMSMASHLWVQWAERAEAVIVTEFAVYPRGIWLRVFQCGAAKDRRLDEPAFLSALEEFRLVNACRGYEVIGRIGWLKRLKSAFPNLDFEGVLLRATMA